MPNPQSVKFTFPHLRTLLGADARSPAALGEFKGDDNVFRLPRLSSGQKYWWRIDAVMQDGSVIQGELWHFRTAAEK